MNPRLSEILNQFIRCGWERIADPAKAWLRGVVSRQALMDAILQANEECGSCGCELDALYPDAIELLKYEPDGYRYGKLVRDRIPEIIHSEGYTPHVRVLDEGEYIAELNRKLKEEAEEYLSDENPEEIADILEVIEAICTAKGYTKEQIETIKSRKKEARGGFENRLYLESKE